MVRSRVVALAVGLATAAAVASLRAQDSQSARVDEIFKEFSVPGSPGCTAGAYQGERVVHRGAYGMANLDHDVRLSPSSPFHVASVSKQFTATAVLLLAADGKLSLDDEVRKFVPELPDFGQRITIRQLAHHTSGVRDQWDLLGLAGWRYSRDLITDDDVLQLLAKQKGLNFTPGERHLYSNSGYTLLAVIVSRASGKPFREFTTERIFKPLGMTSTFFRNNFNEVVKGQAYGYARDSAGFRLSVTNFDTAGATSLMTTVEDLAKWHANFDSGVVGGKPMIAALLTRGVLNDKRSIDYAFGITHGTYRGVATVSHGGADAGYRAAYLRFPAQGFGVAVLCNLASTNPMALAQRVADVYLADALGPAAGPVAAKPNGTPEIPVPAAELEAVAGLYWNATDAIQRRFVFQNGKLHAVTPALVVMKSLGSGQFETTSPGPPVRVAFDRTVKPIRATFTLPSGTVEHLERAEPYAPAATALAAFVGSYRSDEIDPVYRMSVRDGALRLERLKAPVATLTPLLTDTFTSPIGIIRFTRDSSGRVTGFVLDGGRIKRMTFVSTQPPK
jgi:CubicO group peptidase (beta-lactamase class C family)